MAISVSTHSLARRLTENCQKTVGKNICFNSQPRKEADDGAKLIDTYAFQFQLTASQGG